MKSLLTPDTREAIEHRLARLGPDSPARWGRMSSHQAVCHLADGFRMVLGDRPIEMRGGFFTRTLIRFMVLTLPVPWPKGVPTAPEIDQEREGTNPGEFEADRRQLLQLIDRFVTAVEGTMSTHPIFGDLTRNEWGRWAYRHMDHHLTQFGV